MEAESKSILKKYNRMLQKLKLEVAQRKAVTDTLKQIERHYASLLKESYRTREQLHHLSRQILIAHEEERKRISRQLHDEIGQILSGINMRLAALKTESEIHNAGVKRKIASTQKLVEKSMRSIHKFARDLRPSVLDDVGLIAALESCVEEMAQRSRIPIRFRAVESEKIKRLNSVQRTAFYRVGQEALSNVAKHAKASRAQLSLHGRDGVIHMEIKDNGKSFSVESMMHRRKLKRLGLIGMRERMNMIGGSFTIESKRGKGTTVRVQAPVKIPNGTNRDLILEGF